jgi:uncharacterized linocin/CFP29 family protein
MNNDLVECGWTEDQWNRVVNVVSEEAQKARVAAQLLPVIGPEDSAAVGFADHRLQTDPNPIPPPAGRLETTNLPNHRFTTIAAQVQLRSTEMADRDLEAAMVKFRRAANVVARLEDAVIFNDRIAPGNPAAGVAGIPPVYRVTGGGPNPGTAVELGLLPLDLGFGPITSVFPRLPVVVAGPFPFQPTIAQGQAVVQAIVEAMGLLERSGQTGPFACALSPYFYEAVYVPGADFVAAKDRVLPILNGPLVRASAITDTGIFGNRTPYGVVVALGGNPAAMRVASDIGVRFIQVTPEPRYLFRVSERLGLRLTDPRAVAVLTP